MSKKTKQKANLSITIILVIGIVAVVNFFSYQIFHRWDLTEKNIYSISDVSKKTVSELDDVVNIKAYFSDNLPNQVLSLKQEVADILDEYVNYSKGSIRVEFINPGDDEEMQQELMMKGIPQLTFQVFEKDKAQLVNGYMAIEVVYGNKSEIIPAVKQDTSDLEYQITTAIKKVYSDEIATIGYVTNHGTKDTSKEMNSSLTELKGLYNVREVEIIENQDIPQDVNTLIIAGPKEEFTEGELKTINSFVKRGGNLLVLMDGINIDNRLQATKNEIGLDNLLSKYGVVVQKDLVADVKNSMATFSQGYFSYSVNYPFWPAISGEGFNHDNSAVSNLEKVVLQWASSVNVDPERISSENYSYLLMSSKEAWSVKDNFQLNPSSISPPSEKRSFNLAVLLNGGIVDAYPEEGEEANAVNSRIIVVGDSDFVDDNFIQGNPDNLTLFQNLVDLLSLDDDLINIRSRVVSSRPLKEGLSSGTIGVMRYLNVFGVTILVLIYGVARYYMRKKTRFTDDL